MRKRPHNRLRRFISNYVHRNVGSCFSFTNPISYWQERLFSYFSLVFSTLGFIVTVYFLLHFSCTNSRNSGSASHPLQTCVIALHRFRPDECHQAADVIHWTTQPATTTVDDDGCNAYVTYIRRDTTTGETTSAFAAVDNHGLLSFTEAVLSVGDIAWEIGSCNVFLIRCYRSLRIILQLEPPSSAPACLDSVAPGQACRVSLSPAGNIVRVVLPTRSRLGAAVIVGEGRLNRMRHTFGALFDRQRPDSGSMFVPGWAGANNVTCRADAVQVPQMKVRSTNLPRLLLQDARLHYMSMPNPKLEHARERFVIAAHVWIEGRCDRVDTTTDLCHWLTPHVAVDWTRLTRAGDVVAALPTLTVAQMQTAVEQCAELIAMVVLFAADLRNLQAIAGDVDAEMPADQCQLLKNIIVQRQM